jgi:hypothetical protein
MGVWSTSILYQPHTGRTVSELLPVLERVAEALSIETFSMASLGNGPYTEFNEDDLCDLQEQPIPSFRSTIERFPQAEWLSCGCIFGEPAIVDEANAFMQTHEEVTGEFHLSTFGMTIGRIAFDDEEGDELLQTDILIDFAGDRSPDDCEEFSRLLMEAPPVQKLLRQLSEFAPPTSWRPAFRVS